MVVLTNVRVEVAGEVELSMITKKNRVHLGPYVHFHYLIPPPGPRIAFGCPLDLCFMGVRCVGGAGGG